VRGRPQPGVWWVVAEAVGFVREGTVHERSFGVYEERPFSSLLWRWEA
jgi:hypothetical protein